MSTTMIRMQRGLFTAVLAALFMLCSSGFAAEMTLYPTGPLNPRIPNIPPGVDAGSRHVLPFDTEFTYQLAPLITFGNGGELTVAIRDNPQRLEKKILTLSDGKLSLVLRIRAASSNRQCEVTLLDGKKETGSIELARPEPGSWSLVKIKWDASGVSCTQDGKECSKVPLPRMLAPQNLQLQTWHVADLAVRGQGQLTLNWAKDYSARVETDASAKNVSARVFGFDTYVISQDSTKRDFPILQVLNAGREPVRVPVRFHLTSEINQWHKSWEQTFTIAAGSQTFEPIRFPDSLVTDVYHLSIDSPGLGLKQDNHFMFVQRRGESAGPFKFGLHDSNVKAFGFWPDALPIDVAHVYARWSYIQGPPWIKDFNGQWGIDPARPPEEWNWTPKVDWVVQEGHKPYVSISGEPLMDWQRDKSYPESRMKKYAWGLRGGTPNDAGYRRFLQAFIARYKGKVWAYEVENEPNTGHGFFASDYAGIAKAVYEEVKAADAQARVFGICGTGSFIGWMKDAFKAGTGNYLDGVSWHTYVTPARPDEVNLSGMLSDAKEIMKEAPRTLAVINSETGTYVAPREEIDSPMSDERLAQQIADGVSPLLVSKGWPSRAMSERNGAISLTTNAITNFLAGAECFVFFGWNPDWPEIPKWKGAQYDDSFFCMLSVTPDGVHTPSQFTLAAGVLTAQLESADHTRGHAVQDFQLRGSIFPKKDGGRVAVLWSLLGTQSVQMQSSQSQLEIVSMLGQPSFSRGTSMGNGKYLHILDVTEEPIYVHQTAGELMNLPGIVRAVSAEPSEGGKVLLNVLLQNPGKNTWSQSLRMDPDSKWTPDVAERKFEIVGSQQTRLQYELSIKPGVARGKYPVALRLTLPGGQEYRVSAGVPIAPTFGIPKLPAGTTLTSLREWKKSGHLLLLNRPEQVMIGRPPALASLQEKNYWGGPEELSAQVKIGHDSACLMIYAEVRDAHARVPDSWPGVLGSCVEFFLDFRKPGGGLGMSRYEKGVHQIIVRPAIGGEQAAAVWQASSKIQRLTAESGRIDGSSYWVAIRIPWSDVGVTPVKGMPIGIDIGVDGAGESAGRKSQIILFGSENNNRDASRFGRGFLGE